MAGKHNFELSKYPFHKTKANTRVQQIVRVDQEEPQKVSTAELSNPKTFQRLQSGVERATRLEKMNPHRRPRKKTSRPSYAAFAGTWWRMKTMSER